MPHLILLAILINIDIEDVNHIRGVIQFHTEIDSVIGWVRETEHTVFLVIGQIISCGPQILTVFLIISFDEIRCKTSHIPVYFYNHVVGIDFNIGRSL